MSSISRNGLSSLLFVFVFTFLTAIVPASADSVSVTSGFLDMNFFGGPLVLGGDRGFTYRAGVSLVSGFFAPDDCNRNPFRCVPGGTLSLEARWSGPDASGTATLDGVTYFSVNPNSSNNSMRVTFSGSTTLPPLAASATLTVPFSFSGFFVHTTSGSTTTGETLSGGGTATVSLVAATNFPGAWSVRRVIY